MNKTMKQYKGKVLKAMMMLFAMSFALAGTSTLSSCSSSSSGVAVPLTPSSFIRLRSRFLRSSSCAVFFSFDHPSRLAPRALAAGVRSGEAPPPSVSLSPPSGLISEAR